MGRPREFDEEEVLDAALEAFWRYGYEATSVSQLMEATGLAKGSLYKAFGDKKSLMLKALSRYLDSGYAHARATLFDAPSALEGIEAWLRGAAERATCAEGKGCFAVNCTIESAPHDPDIRALLVRQRERIERLFGDVIARGVERGELREGLDPEVAARFVATVVSGLQVLGKGGLGHAQADAQVELALSALR